MVSFLVAAVALLSVVEDFTPRLDTLKFHLSRLDAIVVPAELQAEKDGKLTALKAKLDAGVASREAFNALYMEMDGLRTWLNANTPERPSKAPGTFEDLPDAWRVTTPELTLSVAKADGAMEVKTAAQTWRFAPCGTNDIERVGANFSLMAARAIAAEAFAPGYAVGMTLSLSDFPDAPGFALHLTANLIGNEIVFELAAEEQDSKLLLVNWPKPVLTGTAESDFAVIPEMQGMLLPGNWPQHIHQEDLCNSRTIYMPWWGQIQNGHGVMTILETSDDAGVEYSHSALNPTVIQPRWYSSLGQLRYLRTVRYIFDDAATYVTQAKRYRRYVKEQGDFVSLEEKRARTPNVNEVIGRPVIHQGALYHFVPEAQLFNKDRIEQNHALQTFDQLAEGLRQVKAAGIDDAYVHLDGWGFYGYDNGHPDVMPVGQEQGGWDGLLRYAKTCEELGYLFAVHDQYRDFYKNAVSYDPRFELMRFDGARDGCSVWCGGPQTFLNPRFSPGYVRRNHDLFAAHGIPVRGAYLDVFDVVPLEENAQPAHPITRAQCAEYRRDCFDLLRARGYVVSSEEPADYLIRSLDLVHHGPYPLPGGGKAQGIPVPLLNLVYHDSILLPWSMSDDGGWGIPDGDAGRLHCVLNAGLPYVGPGESAEEIARTKEAAALAAHCGLCEMTNHEFLDGNLRKQRSTFSDGTQITVDFDTKEYAIAYP